MPIITLDGPTLSLEQKRTFVAELTALAAHHYALAEASIIVQIRENAPDNVGVGGKLLVDR